MCADAVPEKDASAGRVEAQRIKLKHDPTPREYLNFAIYLNDATRYLLTDTALLILRVACVVSSINSPGALAGHPLTACGGGNPP